MAVRLLKKKLMIVGAGKGQVPLITLARQMGFETIAISVSGNYPGSAMSIIPPPIHRSPVLRKLFSIPDTNVVVGSIILGYPTYQYKRAIKRNLKGVTGI